MYVYIYNILPLKIVVERHTHYVLQRLSLETYLEDSEMEMFLEKQGIDHDLIQD